MPNAVGGYAPPVLFLPSFHPNLAENPVDPLSPAFHNIWSTHLPPALPHNIWNSVCLLVLWKIWDAQNNKVLRDNDHHVITTIRNILSDLTCHIQKNWNVKINKIGTMLACLY
jgi:hypothetical protein